MNGYKAFFNGKETDIYADSLYQAKQKAIEFFKPAKSKAHMVHVHLCELAGKQVVHVADF
ncbi:MAG: hypothetical protein IM631_12875 [Cytophagales bacterium]|nr:hypothetical protein [Cytophagales bacterium]MCA6382411.1 hypothetical protein [Cytophagales bacterium]